MKSLKKLAIFATLLVGVMAFGAGCGDDSSSTTNNDSNSGSDTNVSTEIDWEGTVTASGSSALLPLATVGANNFMDMYPNASIIVNGGGSGTGLTQVSEGAVDIGNSDVFAEEKLDATAAAELVDHKVCTVTMAAVVNADLGIDDLTQEQLIAIFTGDITNWSEVGGPDLSIMLVTRPSSSGTRAIFSEYGLNGAQESSSSALETDDSGTLLETVIQNTGAIGYVAISYLTDDVVALAIDGVEPNLENTYNGTYTVWGYEHMYTNGEGSEIAQAFLEYMMSEEFASNIEELGYGASSKLSDEAIASHE